MAGTIILITGGARSGKSSFAERCAAGAGRSVAYIATARMEDDEMGERIRLHRQRRPAHWLTWEAPSAAQTAMEQAGCQADIILFDCLTLYTANLMLAADAPRDREQRRQFVIDDIIRLLDSARATQKTVIFVTNEVGQGIVPDNPLAREFRDLAGAVNQLAAAAADKVYLTVCGLAIDVKKLSVDAGEIDL